MVQHWFTAYLTDYYSKNKTLGLDIGCGKKPYQQIFNCKYIGIDVPSKLENNKDKPDFFANGDCLPFNVDTFDFVTCYSVIPYIEKIDQFLDEMHRVMKHDGIAVITIMNLKALSNDPDGYYPNKFSSKQLEKKLSNHNFKSIKHKNLKATIWSSYFDRTSVYSYAIVQCKKISKRHPVSGYTKRQNLRFKVIDNPKLYDISKNLYRNYCNVTQNFHTLPDFLIIGAAKCGTSSLYDYLMQHPSVGKSLTKQIHFFDRYFDRGLGWYKVCFPLNFEKFYFQKILKKIFVTGEATPHYMTHPLAAKRAYSLVPNVKIIVMLRNPVDRAYSHYMMEKDHGKEELSFEDAIENEDMRSAGEFEKMLNNEDNIGINYPHRAYIKSGEYLKQIKRWRKYYSKENFLFIKSEDFNKNPNKVYNDVLNFLGLSPYKLPEYKKIRKRNYEKMNLDTRMKLTKYFEPLNKQLDEYLGIDFHWKG